MLGLHQRMDEGSWAEVAAFEEAELAVKPAVVCWQLAAALPVAGLTALSALLCCPALQKVYSQHSSSVTSSTTAAVKAAGAVSCNISKQLLLGCSSRRVQHKTSQGILHWALQLHQEQVMHQYLPLLQAQAQPK